MRRREILAGLAATAASGAAAHHTPDAPMVMRRVRDALLGLTPPPPTLLPTARLRGELAAARAEFDACRYTRLLTRLPRLITHADHHTATTNPDPRLSAEVYLLATRALSKHEDQQTSWLAAEKARILADRSGDALLIGEAARNLAVLARAAGWHDQALAIALNAADDPRLHDGAPATTAQRGLLLQSAAYTAARAGDTTGMRHLTDEAESLATQTKPHLLREHGGSFTIATVQLHRISAENSLHETGAALSAARTLAPDALPTVERKARYYTDIAHTLHHAGRRDQAVHALQAAHHLAPEAIRSRRNVRMLLTSILATGPTTPVLRNLAAHAGIR